MQDNPEWKEAQMEARESTDQKGQKGTGISRAGTTRQNLSATLLTIAATSSQAMAINSPQQQKGEGKVNTDSRPPPSCSGLHVGSGGREGKGNS